MAVYKTVTSYSYIQTFYADPDRVGGSNEISLTDVTLFFKTKADSSNVRVAICEVENDQPVLSKVYSESEAYLTSSSITTSLIDPRESGTVFTFLQPVKITTGRWYGVLVVFGTSGFELWTNKVGDNVVNAGGGQGVISGGSIEAGKLYRGSNSNALTAINNEDLMYSVNIAKYTSNTTPVVYTNPNYEFLTITNRSATRFLTGERVYKQTANATGNVALVAGSNTIVGNGTSFTSYSAGTPIVVYGNTTHTQVLTISSIANNTYLTVNAPIPYSNAQTKFTVPVAAKVYYQDDINRKLYLTDSNANTSSKLAAGDILIGEDSRANCSIVSVDAYSLDRFRVFADANTPSSGQINLNLGATVYDGASYTFDTNKFQNVQINSVNVTDISDYDAYVLSRSLEVDNATLYSNNSLGVLRKSLVISGSLSVGQSNAVLYSVPTISTAAIDLFTIQNKTTNTYTTTDANGVVIDTEVSNQGIALSKHISKKVAFANNKFAEDVRVFMTAYRPVGTDIKVYAKVYNSQDPDAYVDKAWSPLEYKENINNYSSSEDGGDFIEYELGLPQHSEIANTLPGTFTTQLGNNIIVAAGVTSNTYVKANDVIKLYSPLFANTDYIVAVVTAANTSTITLGAPIANNGVVGSGMKVERLKYYNTAFNNITNDNVARYYNSSLVEFDKFDSMQIKIVLLADNTYKVPSVDQIQVIGVSA